MIVGGETAKSLNCHRRGWAASYLGDRHISRQPQFEPTVARQPAPHEPLELVVCHLEEAIFF